MIPAVPDLPPGSVPLRVVTIVDYLDEDGTECTTYETTGAPTVRQVLAMLEITRLLAGASVVREGLD